MISFCDCIFLNWNPAIYPYRKTINSKWYKGDIIESKFWCEKYSVEYNPQFLITIPPHDDDFEVLNNFLLLVIILT